MLYYTREICRNGENRMQGSYKFIHKLTVISACVAFYTVCSWISIPFFINFSLQIFAIFLIASLFPLSISLISTASYLAIGLIGIPVFSGFSSGISVLFGPAGGYLIGFLISSFLIAFCRARVRKGGVFHLLIMLSSLLICYLFATLWYMLVFKNNLAASVFEALTVCVLPYVIPDILKILLVSLLAKKLDPYAKRLSQKI